MPLPRLLGQCVSKKASLPWEQASGSHSVTSWAVAIVVAADEGFVAVVLEFLLQRQSVELPSEGKLSVDLFLGDVEVLDVKEANFRDGVVQLLNELLFAAGPVELAEVEGDKFRPVNCYEPVVRTAPSQLSRKSSYVLHWSPGLVHTSQ